MTNLTHSAGNSRATAGAAAKPSMNSTHEPLAHGVRPSSGAAALARTIALASSRSFFTHKAAAPEDGRTPGWPVHEPRCSAGVPPASSPSVSLDEGLGPPSAVMRRRIAVIPRRTGGETPPELAAVDGCATPCWFMNPMRFQKAVDDPGFPTKARVMLTIF
jgi:hypothetical protein